MTELIAFLKWLIIGYFKVLVGIAGFGLALIVIAGIFAILLDWRESR